MQSRRVDACVTDGHCSAPLGVYDFVALYNNGRVMSSLEYGHAVGIVDAVSGAKLSERPYSQLVVDTSGALLWRGVEDTVVVSSGLHSAGRTLTCVRWHNRMMHFRYGVVFDLNERQGLRFDLNPAPAVEPDR